MIVLDASALVEVVLALPHRDWVLARLVGEDVAAPAHQLVEVASALARLERAGVVDADDAVRALDDAAGLPQRVEALTPALVHRAYALRGSLRVADSFYVALAERDGAVLLTTDGRLARAGLPCRVAHP